MHRAYIGLGANLGDARAALDAALQALAALPRTRLLRRSSIYRSAPIESSGPDYLNAVAELRTGLAPHELLRDCRPSSGTMAASARTAMHRARWTWTCCCTASRRWTRPS